MNKKILIWILVFVSVLGLVNADYYGIDFNEFQLADKLDEVSGDVGIIEHGLSGWTDAGGTCIYDNGVMSCGDTGIDGESAEFYSIGVADIITCRMSFMAANYADSLQFIHSGTGGTWLDAGTNSNQFRVKIDSSWTNVMALTNYDWYDVYVTYNGTNDVFDIMIKNNNNTQNATLYGQITTGGITGTPTGFYIQSRDGVVNKITNVTCFNGTFLDEPEYTAPPVPSVTLTAPATANITNKDVNFTFTIATANTDDCQLFHNGTGTMSGNITISNTNIGIYDFGKVGLGSTSGNYLWGVRCNDSGSFYWSTTNNTYTVDLEMPTIILSSNNQFNENNLSINNPYGNDFNASAIFGDTRDLWQVSYVVTSAGQTYFNYTNLTSGTSFNLNNWTNMSSWGAGDYLTTLKVADSHTTTTINDYSITKSKSQLIFNTYEGINIQISSKDGSITNSIKKNDRYTTEFKFDDRLKTVRQFFLRSDHKITYLENSQYAGHFVITNGLKGNWIDFESEKVTKDSVAVVKIDDYNYKIYIINLDSEVKFNSVGSLNIVTKNYQFYRGNYSFTTPKGYVGEQTTLQLDLSNGTGINEANAELIYNGIHLGSSSLSTTATAYTLTDTFTTSTTPGNFSYYWIINVTQSEGTTFSFNTSIETQEILDWTLDDCSTQENEAIIFSDWLEDYIPYGQNLTYDINIEYWTNNLNQKKNYSTTLTNSQNLSICISKDFYSNIYLQAQSTSGFTHRYYYYNKSLINGTLEHIKIYNFNTTTNIATLRVTARNQATYAYYSNIVVTLQRYYPGSNTWRNVQMGLTDDYGFVSFNLKEKSDDYRMIYRDTSNHLLKTTAILTFSCDNSVCSVIALLTPYELSASTNNVTVSYAYNNDTKILSVGWRSGLAADISAYVFQERGSGTTELFNYYTSGSTIGSTTFNLSAYTGTIWLKVNSTYEGEELINFGAYITLAEHKLDYYVGDAEGAIYGFFIMLVVIAFGLWSPVAVIMSCLFGLIIVYLTGIVSAINITFMIIAAFIGIVLALKMET